MDDSEIKESQSNYNRIFRKRPLLLFFMAILTYFVLIVWKDLLYGLFGFICLDHNNFLDLSIIATISTILFLIIVMKGKIYMTVLDPKL
jgi:hypothetical protein